MEKKKYADIKKCKSCEYRCQCCGNNHCLSCHEGSNFTLACHKMYCVLANGFLKEE